MLRLWPGLHADNWFPINWAILTSLDHISVILNQQSSDAPQVLRQPEQMLVKQSSSKRFFPESSTEAKKSHVISYL